MKYRGVISTVALGALVAGCGLSGRSDQADAVAQLLAQEVSDIGQSSGDIMRSSSLGKTAVSLDTVRANLTINRFAFDSACGCYIREASFTTSGGYERIRIDTVTFRDIGGQPLKVPTWSTLSTLEHRRHVTHAQGGDEVDIHLNTVMTLSVGVETTGVWNGTLSGTYNGESVSTGSIAGVASRHTAYRWQFPHDGTVKADFPRFAYEIEFLGDGKALAYITNKRRDRVTEVTVDVR